MEFLRALRVPAQTDLDSNCDLFKLLNIADGQSEQILLVRGVSHNHLPPSLCYVRPAADTIARQYQPIRPKVLVVTPMTKSLAMQTDNKAWRPWENLAMTRKLH